jgi:hypothetical protein
MLTVAQVKTTATVVMTARRQTARRVLMVPTVALTLRSAGMLTGARRGKAGRVNSERLDHEPAWPSAALSSAPPSPLRRSRLIVHGQANGSSPHLPDKASHLR